MGLEVVDAGLEQDCGRCRLRTACWVPEPERVVVTLLVCRVQNAERRARDEAARALVRLFEGRLVRLVRSSLAAKVMRATGESVSELRADLEAVLLDRALTHVLGGEQSYLLAVASARGALYQRLKQRALAVNRAEVVRRELAAEVDDADSGLAAEMEASVPKASVLGRWWRAGVLSGPEYSALVCAASGRGWARVYAAQAGVTERQARQVYEEAAWRLACAEGREREYAAVRGFEWPTGARLQRRRLAWFRRETRREPLTAEERSGIVQLLAGGKASRVDAAVAYGVSRALIAKVLADAARP